MSTRFLLVRHARVADSWHGRIYGNLDVPLSPQGEAQSERVAAALSTLRWDAIVDSGLRRARFLAERVGRAPGASASPALEPTRDAASSGPARERDARLREIGRGEWAGLGAAQVEAHSGPGAWQRWLDHGGTLVPPGGETFEELAQRVHSALAELATRWGGSSRHPGRVLIVAHRWVLTVVVAQTLGLDFERGARLGLPTCGAACIDWRAAPRAPQLAGFGPAEQLVGELGTF